MRFYALVSNQGTACAETTLREDNYNDHMRSYIERVIDTSYPDAPIAGSWVDVTGNEACEAMYDESEERAMNDDLEVMIDKHGLSKVLFALAEICSEKAEHLRSNWQDEVSANEWSLDAKAIEKMAARIRTT